MDKYIDRYKIDGSTPRDSYLSALGLPSLYFDLYVFFLISSQQSETTDFILNKNNSNIKHKKKLSMEKIIGITVL